MMSDKLPVPFCRNAYEILGGDGDDENGERNSSPLVQAQREMHEMDALFRRNVAQLTGLADWTNMPLIQGNGQRKFGPRPWCKTPGKGTEVFVGKLPKYMNETHVYNVFSRAGQIYQIRLMLDFNGLNRGFCFVQYCSAQEARQAVMNLNHFEIAEGRRIGVTESVDNCRLFLGGVPKDKTEDDIFIELSRVTDNLMKIFAKPSKSSDTGEENRGFAFAEYASHKDAAMARRKMIPGKIPMWGKVVHVDWAEPEHPETVNRAYGISANVTQQRPGGRFFNNFDVALQKPFFSPFPFQPEFYPIPDPNVLFYYGH